MPIVPLAVVPIEDGLCNASKTNAMQPECVCTWVVCVCCMLDVSVVCVPVVCVLVNPLPANMDPVVPSVAVTAMEYPLPANMDPVVPSVIVTAIVVAGLVAGIVAIPTCVWLKKRKKTTAPVGGAQGQGKHSNNKLLH